MPPDSIDSSSAENEKDGAALLGMARLALTAGDAGAAQGWLEQIEATEAAYDSAQKLKGLVALSEFSGPLPELENAVAADDKNVEAWYALEPRMPSLDATKTQSMPFSA